MPSGKQRLVSTDEVTASHVHSAAVEAHLNAKEAGVPGADDLTSLNKLLQWGAAHSDKPAMAGTDVQSLDREWLSALFPDMNAAVKQLLVALNAELDSDGSAEDIAALLEALEEYLSDINYAQNIGPLKVLPPVLRALVHDQHTVRAAALWAVGSALQDMPDNCQRFADNDGLKHVANALRDNVPAVRLKALRAASAILRAAHPDLRKTFRDLSEETLTALVDDEEAQVRARACFFVANAASSGNAWILDRLLSQENAGLMRAIHHVDVADISAVESLAGTVLALIEHDRAKLLDVCPSLGNDLAALAARCDSDELQVTVNRCADKLK